MKTYVEAEMEIIYFENEDILTTSGGEEGGEGVETPEVPLD